MCSMASTIGKETHLTCRLTQGKVDSTSRAPLRLRDRRVRTEFQMRLGAVLKMCTLRGEMMSLARGPRPQMMPRNSEMTTSLTFTPPTTRGKKKRVSLLNVDRKEMTNYWLHNITTRRSRTNGTSHLTLRHSQICSQGRSIAQLITRLEIICCQPNITQQRSPRKQRDAPRQYWIKKSTLS